MYNHFHLPIMMNLFASINHYFNSLILIQLGMAHSSCLFHYPSIWTLPHVIAAITIPDDVDEWNHSKQWSDLSQLLLMCICVYMSIIIKQIQSFKWVRLWHFVEWYQDKFSHMNQDADRIKILPSCPNNTMLQCHMKNMWNKLKCVWFYCVHLQMDILIEINLPCWLRLWPIMSPAPCWLS